MMRFVLSLLLLAGFAQALQSPAPVNTNNRRNFLAQAGVAATAFVAVVPNAAFAAEPAATTKPKRGAFRGGRGAADDTHNGTDLNTQQASVAGGLLGKMGIPDITPDKGGASKK